jgi:hypothetical protein
MQRQIVLDVAAADLPASTRNKIVFRQKSGQASGGLSPRSWKRRKAPGTLELGAHSLLRLRTRAGQRA